MVALLGDAEAHGATLALSSRVDGGSAVADGVMLNVASEGSDVFTLHASLAVNCAGLGATGIAAAIDGMPASAIPTVHLAKGNYFALSGRAPFTHLIYPLPTPAGLGVHVTPDLGGQAKFGPDVEWLPGDAPIDYAVDPARVAAFAAAVGAWWPGLPDDALSPAYSGVRPKLSGPGEPAADFMISGPGDHGVAGLIHLFGIDSPGLTSSLAIAEHIVALTIDERDRPSVSSDPTMRVSLTAGILTP
jgi:L-2-hydroxyglutarate oxidase LhgO